MMTFWSTVIYALSFLLSGICATYVVHLVMRERMEGPVLRGSFAYWFITQVVQEIGTKEIWTRDKLRGNVWMYADDGVHQSIDGDHVCTLRHEKPKDLILGCISTVIPFLNTLVTMIVLCRIVYGMIEDGAGSNRLVSYTDEHHHDHVPPRPEEDDLNITSGHW